MSGQEQVLKFHGKHYEKDSPKPYEGPLDLQFDLVKSYNVSVVEINGTHIENIDSVMWQLPALKCVRLKHNPKLILIDDQIEESKIEFFNCMFAQSLKKLPLLFSECLHTLIMSHCIVEQLPEAEIMYRNLVRLHLGDNKIEMLPSALSSASKLRELNLENNLLEDFPVHIATKLTSLEFLNLNGNKLTSFHGEICSAMANHLTSLHLDNNQITGVPVELGSMLHLEYVSMKNNQIRDFPAIILMEMRRVRYFHIEGNPLKDSVFDYEARNQELANYKGEDLLNEIAKGYSLNILR